MHHVYSNFDGLDISFKCAVSNPILWRLRDAKQQAQKQKSSVPMEAPSLKKPVMVAEYGSRGGYTYCIDAGLDGAIWFIVDSDKPDNWNVRVSVKSLTLALYGYHKVKEQLLDFLTEQLRARGVDILNEETGEITNAPLERISRVDYCFDFATEFFNPTPRHFVTHGRCKKRIHLEEPFRKSEVIIRGDHVGYIRAGQMPNKQVVLYNKTQEIKERNKKYWWKFWNLNPEIFRGQIWRVEVRAGKKELNNWNLRRFIDLENKLGDVIITILNEIRFTIPNSEDKNVTRWPTALFWLEAIKIANTALASYISNAKRGEVLNDLKKDVLKRYQGLFTGLVTSYTALTDSELDQIPGVLEAINGFVLEQIMENPGIAKRKMEKAKVKFNFE